MLFTVPDYYKKFKCKGSNCTDNCCIGWEIDIDPKTDVLYKNTGGSFGKFLNGCINRSGDVPFFKLAENERCALLNENNLCRIILNMGEESLCQICALHPRFCGYFGNIKEMGLGLCCERVCELIADKADSTKFETQYINEENADECDAVILENTLKIREKLLEMLQNKSISIESRLNFLAQWALPAQSLYENNSFDQITALFGSAAHCAPLSSESTKKFMALLMTLEVMDEKWTSLLKSIYDHADIILNEEAAFDAAFCQKDIIYENTAVYFIFRYFLKAVYSGDILSPMLFTFFSLRVIKLCDIFKWLKNGRKLSTKDRIDNLKLYSKEIEYSEENMDKIYDFFWQ